MSFNRILVALDQSPQQDAVFEQALDIAKCQRSQLMLLHCVETLPTVAPPAGGVAPIGAPYPTVGMAPDPIVMGSEGPDEQNYWQQEIESHRRWLNDYYQRAIAKDIPTEFDCMLGKPEKHICQQSEDWQADLIVMGRQGRSGLAELVMGSVSNHVVHHAPCSVLVIQHQVAADSDESSNPLHTSSNNHS